MFSWAPCLVRGPVCLINPNACPCLSSAKGAAIDGLTTIGEAPVVRFHGSIAGWAAALTACRRAFSYDSVGHHLAAALGVPVVVAFTGHSDPAFPVAWQPRGSGPVTLVVIPTAEKHREAHTAEVIAAIGRLV